MSKILKDYELNMEGQTLYDGKKTILANVLRGEGASAKENAELVSALESIPSSLQKYIISYIENYKNKTGKEFKEKENSVFEAAKQKGYAEGFESGKSEALKSMEEGVKNIFSAAESIKQFKNELYEDVKKDVITLSIKIAETITKSKIAADDDILLNIIASAINQSSDAVNFTICLNPEDYKVLNKNPDALKDFLSKEAVIDFIQDKNIRSGNVVIKTDFGEIDARISTQIERITNMFTKVF
ncbi:MAG: FliH/SctL family protein [Deltaproteobacteria bacterium]|nr:FliH/SctL family protein [Deltaproteobacteria bacterium]MCL6120461.1 FliH/SctL family protein [Deltaproteobacteria bacterium]